MIIYKVTNLVNGKIYIGKTVKKLNRRKKEHMVDCRGMKYNSVFHAAIRKYGKENFIWEIVDKVLFSESLIALEKYYIRFFNCMVPNGYNLTKGGDGCGHPCSETHKMAMSLARKGVPRSDEAKRNMSIANTGRIVSYKTRKKISLTMMGKPKSKETIDKMTIARRSRISKEVMQ